MNTEVYYLWRATLSFAKWIYTCLFSLKLKKDEWKTFCIFAALVVLYKYLSLQMADESVTKRVVLMTESIHRALILYKLSVIWELYNA